jgi:phosphoglycerol transferase MdoB-like AlkP superfamily enzyme
MTALAAAVALSFLASLAVESFPPNFRAFRAPPLALLLRAGLHVALFAAAFALSWRSWHAAFVVVAIAFLFGLGSATKRNILGEPLVFTDFALVRLAIRHPRLYYAERLVEPRALALFAALAIATAAWFALEAPILPQGGWPLLVAPPLLAAGLGALLLSSPVSTLARSLAVAQPDPDEEVRRLGLGASLLIHWLAWRRAARPSPQAVAAASALPRPSTANSPGIVVAIQCESFVDLPARGVVAPPLPAWEALKREAVSWGRCGVPAEGAYTMRSEFGFLTGLPSATLGLDAFDPFLTARAYAADALPRRFAEAGWRTIFMHPYDRRFFDRHEIMPALGFERFVDGDDFSAAERFGPYVSDMAVADAIIAEIEAATEPTFLFAVTIENHGPWGLGRLAGTDDPTAQYLQHLANADRMIGRVAEALAGRRDAVLCLYGDHAPARTILPDLPGRRQTDYALWRPDVAPEGRLGRRDVDVDELAAMLVRAL